MQHAKQVHRRVERALRKAAPHRCAAVVHGDDLGETRVGRGLEALVEAPQQQCIAEQQRRIVHERRRAVQHLQSALHRIGLGDERREGRVVGVRHAVERLERRLQVQALDRQEEEQVRDALDQHRRRHVEEAGIRLALAELRALDRAQRRKRERGRGLKPAIVQQKDDFEQRQLFAQALPRPQQRIPHVVADRGGQCLLRLALEPRKHLRRKRCVGKLVEHRVRHRVQLVLRVFGDAQQRADAPDHRELLLEEEHGERIQELGKRAVCAARGTQRVERAVLALEKRAQQRKRFALVDVEAVADRARELALHVVDAHVHATHTHRVLVERGARTGAACRQRGAARTELREALLEQCLQLARRLCVVCALQLLVQVMERAASVRRPTQTRAQPRRASTPRRSAAPPSATVARAHRETFGRETAMAGAPRARSPRRTTAGGAARRASSACSRAARMYTQSP